MRKPNYLLRGIVALDTLLAGGLGYMALGSPDFSRKGLEAEIVKPVARVEKTQNKEYPIKVEEVSQVQEARPQEKIGISQEGIDLIKKYEGFREEAYKCPAGIWTIGYGHTEGVRKGDSITREEGEVFLRQDLKSAEDAIDRYVKVDLTENQRDALISFQYNTGALGQSTLLKRLNSGDYSGAANEFSRWNKVKGKVVQGLVNRRAEEKSLFENK